MKFFLSFLVAISFSQAFGSDPALFDLEMAMKHGKMTVEKICPADNEQVFQKTVRVFVLGKMSCIHKIYDPISDTSGAKEQSAHCFIGEVKQTRFLCWDSVPESGMTAE